MAPALTRLRSVREIQQELLRLREAAGAPGQAHIARTSVMTHIAWVPPEWRSAALQTLAGLEEQHPSRTILLFPEPLAADDAFVLATILYNDPAREDARRMRDAIGNIMVTLPR